MNYCLKTLNINDFLFLRSILASVFFKTVYKTTASQNVERRHISSTIVHPSLDVGHGISRGLPNDIDCLVFCVILPVSQPHHRT